MSRLTEVQRGQAIALLMQGQWQQQVALHLVRRLRDTGRVADRPQRGRPRVMAPRQDRIIRLAHLRNRHVTDTETALTMVGNHNRHIQPKTMRNRPRVWSASSSTLHWFSSHSCTSYGLVGGTWSQTMNFQ